MSLLTIQRRCDHSRIDIVHHTQKSTVTAFIQYVAYFRKLYLLFGYIPGVRFVTFFVCQRLSLNFPGGLLMFNLISHAMVTTDVTHILSHTRRTCKLAHFDCALDQRVQMF